MTPRGGSRQGKPGKAYPSRTDLSAPKPEAGINRPAPGQQYGAATQQAAAMKAVPVQAPKGPDMATLDAQAMNGWEPVPGSPTETTRPDEPVTAGLATGPGPGPEVLPQIGPPPNPDTQKMIRQLPLLQILASNPDATAQTRMLYRQVLTAYYHSEGV